MNYSNGDTITCELIPVSKLVKLKNYKRFIGNFLYENKTTYKIESIKSSLNILVIKTVDCTGAPKNFTENNEFLISSSLEKPFYKNAKVEKFDVEKCIQQTFSEIEKVKFETLQGDKNEVSEKKVEVIDAKPDRKDKLKSLKDGKLTKYISILYDHQSKGWIEVNTFGKAVKRIDFIDKESARRKVFRKKGLQLTAPEMFYLPDVTLHFNPKLPFGVSELSFETESSAMFNTHTEPNFYGLKYNDEEKTDDGYAIPKGIYGLFRNLFENDGEAIAYVFKWLSNLVRRNKNETAILMFGIQGAGKNLFYELIKRMIGIQNCVTINTKLLENDHTEPLLGKRLYFLNELNSTFKNESLENSIKMLITDEEIMINPKGRTQFVFKNVGNVILGTNSDHSNKIPQDDRRFSVFQQKKELNKEIADMVSNLTDKEILAFKRFLFNMDTSDHNFRKPFENETRTKMMRRTGTKKENLISDIRSNSLEQLTNDIFSIDDNGNINKSHLWNDNHFQKLIARTQFKDMLVNIIFDTFKNDIAILRDKQILTSRLGAMLYREAIESPNSSTTAIGNFYSNSFGEKSKTHWVNGKATKGYKVEL